MNWDTVEGIWMAVLGGIWTCLVFLGWVFTTLTPLAILSHIIHWTFGPKGVDYGYTENAKLLFTSGVEVIGVVLAGALLAFFVPVFAPVSLIFLLYPLVFCPLGLLLLFYQSAFDIRKWRAVRSSLRSRGDDIDLTDHLVS